MPEIGCRLTRPSRPPRLVSGKRALSSRINMDTPEDYLEEFQSSLETAPAATDDAVSRRAFLFHSLVTAAATTFATQAARAQSAVTAGASAAPQPPPSPGAVFPLGNSEAPALQF